MLISAMTTNGGAQEQGEDHQEKDCGEALHESLTTAWETVFCWRQSPW
jgi:hypothetical protein